MSRKFHEIKGADNSLQDKLRHPRPSSRPADEMKGKKSSSLHPGMIRPVDPKVAVLLGLSFPIALFVFWNVTLPFLASTCSLITGVDVIQTISFLKADILNAMLLPCPNWLTAEERAFIGNGSPQNIRRVSDLNFAQFEHIVNTGEPVIITDGMKDWPGFTKLNCESFISNYPDAVYFDWQEQVSIALKDIDKRNHYTGLECAAGHVDAQTSANSRYIQDWLNQVTVPYFLSKDVYSSEAFVNASHRNMEVFIGAEHTGISPHLDETCATFVSAQFSGETNWSMSWPIKDNEELKWSNPVVFTLYPGELLFWYVGMRHHTEVLDSCSLSFSFQITTPAPRVYFQNLIETIRSVSETDRAHLFKQTHTNSHFLDSCNIIEKDGKSFITASLKHAT